jgi:branched-chain amino acid transport system substrate-binding protein
MKTEHATLFSQGVHMGQFKGLILVLLVTMLLTACQSAEPPFECTDAIGCVTIGPGEPIEVVALQVQSGEVAPLGIQYIQSSEMAIAERDNQLFDHPLVLHREDSLCSKEGGTTRAQEIITNPQIVAILGTTCSGAAVPAAKIMSEAGLVMVSAGNTAPSLTSVNGQPGTDWQPGYFRTVPSDTVQGRAAATFAFQELGVSKAATLNDGDTYTQGLTDVFSQVFTELGGEIVLDAAINKGDTNMGPVLTAVAVSEAELLFFPIFPPEGNFIIKQSNETEGFETIALMSADGLALDTVLQDVGPAGVGMYFVGPSNPDSPAYEAFDATFTEQYGEAPNPPFHALGYDAANLVLEAIEAVAVPGPSGDGTLHIGRQALRNYLYTTSGFEGVSGSLNCDEFGDCGATQFKVVRLDDPAAGIGVLADNVVYTYNPGE